MKTLYKLKLAGGTALLFALLASCKVSKDVPAPEMALPEAYRSAVADTATIAAVPWKTFFADPQLNSLIDEAVANNFDLQLAVKNIEIAGQTLRQAKWGNAPTLGLQAAAASSRPSDNSLNGSQLNNFLGQKHIEDYNLSASLSWEADIWGKIRSRKASALAEYLATEEARKAVQTQLVSSIAKGYYNLQLLDLQLDIAEKNLKLNDSTLTIINLQYESGQVTSLAVQQAQAQKLTAARLVPLFQQQIAVQENALSVLTGKLPGPIKRSKTITQFDDNLSAGLPVSLLKNRPEIKQSELALEKANAAVGYTKAAMYPSLTISAAGGLNAIQASDWFTMPASLFGVVAGGVTQPLFNQRKLKTQYEIAKVNREQSVIEFRQSVITAVGEVSDALVSKEKFHEQKEFLSEKTAALQKATANSKMLFQNGLATYLEVIIAQANALQSELELAAVRKSELDAAVDLYRSVGGGWK
jgi:NodT family efflux transporter outer membrane factor (OMF) lipoprotein